MNIIQALSPFNYTNIILITRILFIHIDIFNILKRLRLYRDIAAIVSYLED